MNPATKPSEIDRPGAHLRLCRIVRRPHARDHAVRRVQNLSFASDGRRAVAAAAGFFTSTSGEFFVVVGPSGCGKSTLPQDDFWICWRRSTGEILVEGGQVTKPHGNVGIVFQNALLLPWRNILAKCDAADRHEKTARAEYLPGEGAAKTVGLEGSRRNCLATLGRHAATRLDLRALVHDPRSC